MKDTGQVGAEQVPQLGNDIWAYSRDGWQQLEAEPTAEFECGGPADWHSILGRAGFDVRCEREPYLGAVAIYEASRPTSVTTQFQFVVDISLDTDSFRTIYVRDLPALLALMPSLMATKAAIRFDSFSQKLEEIAEKLFRVTHGHDYYVACRQCDPWAAKQQEEADARRRAARAK